jgi:hypothetical protein
MTDLVWTHASSLRLENNGLQMQQGIIEVKLATKTPSVIDLVQGTSRAFVATVMLATVHIVKQQSLAAWIIPP